MKTEIVKNISEAETIAGQVLKEMGTDFFTVAEMRKKMVKQVGKHIQKISWTEAQRYMDYLMRFGFCEEIEKATTPMFRIRMDVEYRKQVYENQKADHQHKISEINIVLGLLETQFKKHAPKKETKKAVKKTTKK